MRKRNLQHHNPTIMMLQNTSLKDDAHKHKTKQKHIRCFCCVGSKSHYMQNKKERERKKNAFHFGFRFATHLFPTVYVILQFVFSLSFLFGNIHKLYYYPLVLSLSFSLFIRVFLYIYIYICCLLF